MKQKSGILLIIVALFCMFSISCTNNKEDSGKEGIILKTVRFENELFAFDIYTLADSFVILHQKYPDFFSLFGNRIIEIGDPSEPGFGDALSQFVTDQAVHEIYNRVKIVHQNFKNPVQELEKGFETFGKLFPEMHIPVIYTYISGFNQSVVVADNILGISLEKYLGTNDPLYNQVYPPLPAYQRSLMNPDRIAIDAMLGWVVSEFDYKPEQDNLLSRMIHDGRNMYLLSKLYPNLSDSVLWGFSSQKMNFCLANERSMWTYLIEQKLLFSTDKFKLLQFTGEAPFTKDFSQESPGKAAIWIGYRIVDSYMRKNAKLTLPELMQENNYQKILNDSRYKP